MLIKHLMAQQYVLGIDIGTGSTKAVAVDYNGHPIASSQSYYETQSPQPGYSEQDPATLWQAFTYCIKDIIAQLNTKPAAICLGSAMHSLLMVNEKGEPLYPMITWADTRSAAMAEQLQNRPEG